MIPILAFDIPTPKCDEASIFLAAARYESAYLLVVAGVIWFDLARSVTVKDEQWLNNVNPMFAKWTSKH